MKFCGKCHKRVLTTITYAINLSRICDCNNNKLLSLEVLQKLNAEVSGKIDGVHRKKCLKGLRKIGVQEPICI